MNIQVGNETGAGYHFSTFLMMIKTSRFTTCVNRPLCFKFPEYTMIKKECH